MANHANVSAANLTQTAGHGVWKRSVGAGLIAAIVMAVFAMIVAASRGPGFFAPMKLISAVVLGQRAMTIGAGAVVLGIAIHLAMGALLGALFAAVVFSRPSWLATVALALIYSTGVYLVMSILILPWGNPVMLHHISLSWFLLYHLAFGLTLGALTGIRTT